MEAFGDYHSITQLRELAKQPLDLTKKDALSEKRIKQCHLQAEGLHLFWGAQRIDSSCYSALINLAKEANVQGKMRQMQDGQVINKIEGIESENRAVLHTAMRDFFDQPNPSHEAKQAALQAREEVDKLESFLPEVDDFQDLVLIGIGGSELGPKALLVAMEPHIQKSRRVFFVSNIDPDDLYAAFNKVDLKRTLVVVVSKSGSTLETRTNEEMARSFFEKENLNPKDHFIAVTGKGSPMDNPDLYRASFYIWDYVGGRYSATSMVGGVMLGFALGFDRYLEILKGASSMDKHVYHSPIEKNLPLHQALFGIWNRNFLKLPTVAIIPYSKALARFPAHLQQCDMESNGKHIDKSGKEVNYETGPIIWGEPGTNGQHSFYQLIHQGTTPVPLEFIGFKRSQLEKDQMIQGSQSQQKLLSNLFAQVISLAQGQKADNPNKQFEGNRPSSLIMADQLTPFTLGQLLSFYEHKVAYQGFLWGINSFDQEGVQLGKKLANQCIDLFKAQNTKTRAETSFPEGQAFLDLLDIIG